jgi:hypothetical protein
MQCRIIALLQEQLAVADTGFDTEILAQDIEKLPFCGPFLRLLAPHQAGKDNRQMTGYSTPGANGFPYLPPVMLSLRSPFWGSFFALLGENFNALIFR